MCDYSLLRPKYLYPKILASEIIKITQGYNLPVFERSGPHWTDYIDD